MTQEVLKLTLEFIEDVNVGEWVGSIERQLEVITAIKETLAQTQEPVAYINVEKRKLEFAHDYVKWDTPTTVKLERIPLYTAPPQRTWAGLTDDEMEATFIDELDAICQAKLQRTWVGLTDEEVRKICVNEWGGYEQCRAIEAKLKELNT